MAGGSGKWSGTSERKLGIVVNGIPENVRELRRCIREVVNAGLGGSVFLENGSIRSRFGSKPDFRP
jgi:hypothetical protein